MRTGKDDSRGGDRLTQLADRELGLEYLSSKCGQTCLASSPALANVAKLVTLVRILSSRLSSERFVMSPNLYSSNSLPESS